MSTIQLNGVNYHLRKQGDGPALLLLHGFTGSWRTWADQITAFSPQHTVIAPDLLGHGETDAPSDPSRYAMEHAAADLISLLDHENITTVDLLGYSMGGRLALYLALHYPQPINRLILESASPGLKTAQECQERTQRDNALADRIERDGIEKFVDFWETLPLWANQAHTMSQTALDALRQDRLQRNPAGLANSLRGMGTGVQPSLWDRLHELTLPTLLIVGEHDHKFLTINQTMCKSIPQAQLEIISNSGHTAHIEQPDRFNRVVLTFLAGR